MSISPNQEKLFGLLSNFAVTTVTSWVEQVYRLFGPKVAAGDAFPGLILPFAQKYFNDCAAWIYSREDDYINKKFDEMTAIPLAGKNEAIDLLQLIVLLALDLIKQMDIRDVITDNIAMSMAAVHAHLSSIVIRHTGLAAYLVGCTDEHTHEEIKPGTCVFIFAIDQYAQTNNGMVKLSHL